MKNSYSLKDKVIIVTGGTGILGNSFIKGIAEAGGTVGILGRNEAVANERADAINKNGGKAVALIADEMDKNQLISAREKVLAQFGRIDGLVNGAGGNMPEGVLQPDEDIFSMNLDGMKKVMELNLWGTLLPTQVFGEEIAKPLLEKMEQGLSEFSLPHTRKFGQDETQSILHFSKGDQKDFTFFNRFDVTLKQPGKEDLTQTCFVGQQYNYTLQER